MNKPFLLSDQHVYFLNEDGGEGSTTLYLQKANRVQVVLLPETGNTGSNQTTLSYVLLGIDN